MVLEVGEGTLVAGEGAGQGLPGALALTNPSHGRGDPCATIWWVLREQDINLFLSPLSFLFLSNYLCFSPKACFSCEDLLASLEGMLYGDDTGRSIPNFWLARSLVLHQLTFHL